MSKLFAAAEAVSGDTSVGVEELADGSIGIRGVTIDEHTNEAALSSIRFSPESIKALRGLLNRLSDEKGEG